MNTYSLKEMSEIMQNSHYVTKARFVNYFKANYETSENEANRLYGIYSNLPLSIYKISEKLESETEVDDLLQKVRPLIEICKNGFIDYEASKDSKSIIKKVYFENSGGDVIECVFDLNSEVDIISYAELLKKRKALKIIDFFEKIENDKNSKEEKWIDIFDGDVFAINDDWHKYEDGDVYLCTDGEYRKLLYTFGVGYMMKGEPNYDPEMYVKNKYGLTLCKGFKKLGNIYIDCSFLIDKNAR